MTNGRYIDIENEVLRNRIDAIKAAALKACDCVERYTNGAALRSELLNTIAALRQTAQGKG